MVVEIFDSIFSCLRNYDFVNFKIAENYLQNLESLHQKTLKNSRKLV